MSTLKATYLQHMGSPDPNITLDNTGGVTFSTSGDLNVSGETFFGDDLHLGTQDGDPLLLGMNFDGDAVPLFPTAGNPSGTQVKGLVSKRTGSLDVASVVLIGENQTANAINMINQNGTFANPEPVNNGRILAQVYAHGWNGLAYQRGGDIRINADGNSAIPAGLVANTGQYTILTSGDTDFTLLGAADSVPGTAFTATESGSIPAVSGTTGTVQFTDYWAGNLPTRIDFITNRDRAGFATGQQAGLVRLSIRSDGTLDLYNSPGINFDSIQSEAPGSTDTLLNHYEKGTWTPTFGSTAGGGSNPTCTYAADGQQGVYTRIGDTVIASFTLELTSVTGGAGLLDIKGLPFAIGSFPINTPGFGTGGVTINSFANITQTNSDYAAITGGRARTAASLQPISVLSDGQSTTSINVNRLQNTSMLKATIVYKVV